MNKNKSKIIITLVTKDGDKFDMTSKIHLRHISQGAFAKAMLLCLKNNLEDVSKKYDYNFNLEEVLLDTDVIDIENMKKAIKEAEEQEELLNDILGELAPKKKGRKPSKKGIEINE